MASHGVGSRIGWWTAALQAGRAMAGGMRSWNTGWLSASNAITLVRRRRWTRRAERIPTERSAKRSEAVVGASCQRGGGGGTATIASSGDHGNGGGNGGNGDAGGGNPTRRNDGLLVGWRGRDESIEGSRDGGVGREGAVVGGGRLDSTPGSPVATSTPNPSLASPPHVQRLLAERSEALDESLGTLGLARGAVGAASSPDRGKLQQPPEQRRQRRSSKEAASLNPASQERSSNGGSCSSAGGSPPTSPPRDATGRTPRLSVDPNGVPWPPLAGGGAALLQLSTAPGATFECVGRRSSWTRRPRCCLTTSQRFTGAARAIRGMPSRYESSSGSRCTGLGSSPCELGRSDHRSGGGVPRNDRGRAEKYTG